MTVLGLVVSTTLPWAILHLIRAFYTSLKHGTAQISLPLPLSGDAGTSRRRGAWDIGPLWLKYETTRWNMVFSSSILTLFSRSRRRHSLDGRSAGAARLARWGVWFYTAGAALCVLAMTLGMALLFWSALGVVWRIARLLGGGTGYLEPGALKEGVKSLVKRASTEETIYTYDADDERPRLYALIPGVTVPLSHLPILLLGLAFSGIIHEAGHAIAASLDNLPLVSTGFHIHLVFPTFFVAISQSLATQPIPSRLRIATAGAWHNFVTWGLLALLGSSVFSITDLYPLPNSGKLSSHDLTDNEVCSTASTLSCAPSKTPEKYGPPSRLWSYLGYANVLERGIVITRVESDSPLYGHLLPGSVVTRIDDMRLGGMDDTGLEGENAFMRWYKHLGMGSAHWARKVQDDAGWCVPETWFSQQSDACCHNIVGNSTAHHHESEGPDSCFNSLKKTSDSKYDNKNTKNERCLDPVSLFTYQHSVSRGRPPINPSIPQTTSYPDVLAPKWSKSGSAYGSRCHVACLRSDGDNEEYVCARPRARVTGGDNDINPTEERLLRLEIEDPPWVHQASITASPSSNPDSDPNSDKYVTREGVPRPHEYRIDPHHQTRPPRPTRILVYKGPTSEILSHVSVGSLQPRSKHFPPLRLPHYIGISLPALFGLFWEYVARLSLSLALFNLLPVIGLDGGVVLSCLIEWWLGDRGSVRAGEEYDVELLERGAGGRRDSEGRNLGRDKRKEMVEKWASISTIVLGLTVVVTTLWQDVG